MDATILKVVGQVAGVAGIALGVFLLLFRDVIRKSIFPMLTKQQAFRLLTLIIVLVWSVALAGIGAWVWVSLFNGRSTVPDDPRTLSLDLHEQISGFRELLYVPPRDSNHSERKLPHPYDEGSRTKWPEPRQSSIASITTLAETHPVPVVRALVPMLTDGDGVVVVGALLALRNILVGQPDQTAELKELLPKGSAQSIDLRQVYIADEDFTIFSGTELFYGGQFQDAVLENVKFDGVTLTLAHFDRASIIQSSFKNANLERSTWRDASVRNTSFDNANLFSVFAQDADFGIATSDASTLFPGNSFKSAILNDAIFNHANMVATRFDGTKLNATQFAGADFTDAYVGSELVTKPSLETLGAILLDATTKYGKGQRP